MAGHRFTWLDVFTGERLAGNGLAVVHDADAIPDEGMHRIARETRLSETSFVQSPGAAGADYRHRIWTMSREIAFAGHPSLGTAVAVARARGETEARYVQQTRAGLQAIEVEVAGDRARASMLQEPPAPGAELDPGEVLETVGLTAGDAAPGLPPQVVSTGVPQVIAPVRAGALARVRPDYDRLGPLLAAHGAVVLYAAALDLQAGTARARSFLGTAEMGEDPATGAAAGPLVAYAAARAGVERLEILQGVEMDRPSVLSASVDGDRVRVGGEAVVLVDGTIHLDM